MTKLKQMSKSEAAPEARQVPSMVPSSGEVSKRKTRGIPQLIAKLAIAHNARNVKIDVTACGRW